MSTPERIALVQEAIFTGAIGIGKTTLASIVIPYMAHWALCLRDPQKFYGLMAGTRIAFMLMSTTGSRPRTSSTPTSRPASTTRRGSRRTTSTTRRSPSLFKFPKDIWIIPGDSSEKTFEGFNILGGIVDEIDSHKVTQEKSYVEQGYDTIRGRVSSRFGDMGFILLIGQMKSSHRASPPRCTSGTAADPHAYAARMSIWDSFGWERFTDADGQPSELLVRLRPDAGHDQDAG